MERDCFKRVVHDALVSSGFKKRKSRYYKEGEQLFWVVDLQKSSYGNGYYINMGVFIKALHQNESTPRSFEGDLRFRFAYEVEGTETDYFDLDTLEDQGVVEAALKRGIAEIIDPSMNIDGLRETLQRKPSLLSLTTVRAKRYLGIAD